MTDGAVTITITRYAEPDALVSKAISGALAQTGVKGEVLFFDQDEGSVLDAAQFCSGNLELKIVRGKLSSLSEARNRALENARFDHILFLDADAIPEPDWANNMVRVLSHPDCAVAGCRIEPGWPQKPPHFTNARVLRDQYSLLDLGRQDLKVARIVGAAFGIDRAKLPATMRFDTSLGRREGRLFGGEESEFCQRAGALGFEVRYCGEASVIHCIQPERLDWRWIAKRMIYAGYGRARQGGLPRPSRKPNISDYVYGPLYLPPYALGWLWGKLARG